MSRTEFLAGLSIATVELGLAVRFKTSGDAGSRVVRSDRATPVVIERAQSIVATVSTQTNLLGAENGLPPLEAGDRLTRVEFERRYEAMPHVKKAELLEGVVHMPSPVRAQSHGRPHAHVPTLVDDAGLYKSEIFPGLWLDAAALVRGDITTVVAALDRGLASTEHAAFLARLESHSGG
jgi:hypothetical protein